MEVRRGQWVKIYLRIREGASVTDNVLLITKIRTLEEDERKRRIDSSKSYHIQVSRSAREE